MYTCIFRSTVKNIYWSTVKTLKFIIRYSEYEYESKFSKLMSTATVRFFMYCIAWQRMDNESPKR